MYAISIITLSITHHSDLRKRKKITHKRPHPKSWAAELIAGAFDMEMLLLIRVLLLRCSARCMTIGWSRRKDATFSKTLTFLLWKPFMSFHLDGGAVLCVLPRDLQEACCCLRVAEGVDWKKRRRLSQLWPPLPMPSIAFIVFFFFAAPQTAAIRFILRPAAAGRTIFA